MGPPETGRPRSCEESLLVRIRGIALKRDDFSSIRHLASARWRMIFRKPVAAFRDHASARRGGLRGSDGAFLGADVLEQHAAVRQVLLGEAVARLARDL